MSQGDVILEAKEVSRWYGTSAEHAKVSVLDRVDFAIREGEFVALLGSSGSGKSTLMRILAGLGRPSDGRVLHHGQPLDGVNRGVAIVFQSFALFPWMTVLENVEMGLRAIGTDRKLAREKAIRCIDMIGLDGFEEAMPRELSRGMKQRVGFARALVMEPEVLCMDEPFSGLDVLTAENLRGELMDLWLEHQIPTKAIFMVTHNIEEAILMADRVIILSHNPGRVAAELPVGISHPRDRNAPEFKRVVDKVYTILTRPAEIQSQGKIRPLALRKFQKLPHARVGALTGLLEIVFDQGGREDIYELESELNLEADDLLPLTEAATILGLATVQEGDICLTDLGRKFADGDILERKEVFREAMAAGVVLANQILQALRAAKRRKMDEEFFLELLGHHVTKTEAERQMDTVIDWGRYAELFAYDEDAGELYLEEAPEGGAADPSAGAE